MWRGDGGREHLHQRETVLSNYREQKKSDGDIYIEDTVEHFAATCIDNISKGTVESLTVDIYSENVHEKPNGREINRRLCSVKT